MLLPCNLKIDSKILIEVLMSSKEEYATDDDDKLESSKVKSSNIRRTVQRKNDEKYM